MLCGTAHPEDAAVICDKTQDNHEVHSGFDPRDIDANYRDWPNESYTPPLQTPDAQVDRKLKRISAGFKAARG